VHYTKFYISFIDVIINNVVIWTISNLNKVWNYLKFVFYILLTYMTRNKEYLRKSNSLVCA
jgi:hypothetical protein